MTLEQGDRVRLINNEAYDSVPLGHEGVVVQIWPSRKYQFDVDFAPAGPGIPLAIAEDEVERIEDGD